MTPPNLSHGLRVPLSEAESYLTHWIALSLPLSDPGKSDSLPQSVIYESWYLTERDPTHASQCPEVLSTKPLQSLARVTLTMAPNKFLQPQLRLGVFPAHTGFPTLCL